MSKPSTNALTELNATELEVALLLAASKLINSMVNHSTLSLLGEHESMTVLPATTESRDLVSILLVDFISPLGSPFNRRITTLQGLTEICESPHFDMTSSISPLKDAVATLVEWLDYEAILEDAWLPSINKQLCLSLKRKDILYICGNMAKHNIFRLDVVTKRILSVLQQSDPDASLKDAHLALDDFQVRIMDDVFPYHLSYICQMLNDILWGIHYYLLPEYHRAYQIDQEQSIIMGAQMYDFDVPPSISSELGKVYYWDLMNTIRGKPYVNQFKADKHLIGRY